MSIELFLGLDLAWQDSRPGRPANETGIAVLTPDGRTVDAGWTRGLDETVDRIAAAGHQPALLFIDAPLVVYNRTGQRTCETQVGQRYWRWKVSANTTNLRCPRQAGVALRHRLEQAGWRYSDGHNGPPTDGRWCCECYPYTTLVGATELGYDAERPRYKRPPRRMPVAQWRTIRQAACDDLIQRLTRLADADPPLRLDSHPTTRRLVSETSPLNNTAYKHREDLVDALLCAWTAALWYRHGTDRCQVLGQPDPGTPEPAPTIIAPARPEQRR
jgi:predicted RNase H-like nuclease